MVTGVVTGNVESYENTEGFWELELTLPVEVLEVGLEPAEVFVCGT